MIIVIYPSLSSLIFILLSFKTHRSNKKRNGENINDGVWKIPLDQNIVALVDRFFNLFHSLVVPGNALQSTDARE